MLRYTNYLRECPEIPKNHEYPRECPEIPKNHEYLCVMPDGNFLWIPENGGALYEIGVHRCWAPIIRALAEVWWTERAEKWENFLGNYRAICMFRVAAASTLEEANKIETHRLLREARIVSIARKCRSTARAWRDYRG